jgi:hypothetical protein
MSSQHETNAPQPREWSEQETVHRPVLPAQQARQGATGQNVRYVLAIGLTACVVIFAAIWWFYFA